MIPFILGAFAAVGLSELSKRGKLKKMESGGNIIDHDNCIKEVVGMVKSKMPVKDFYIIPSYQDKLGLVKGKLIIVLEKELSIDSLPELNEGLKNIEGCSTVFEDEFEIGYKENYKTLVLGLKTDEFNIGKLAKGGGID